MLSDTSVKVIVELECNPESGEDWVKIDVVESWLVPLNDDS